MNLDINHIVNFLKKNTHSSKDEIEEQDSAPASPAPSAPSSGGGKVPPKWADSYTLKRGKANPLTKSSEKWETGMTRGAANQIW